MQAQLELDGIVVFAGCRTESPAAVCQRDRCIQRVEAKSKGRQIMTNAIQDVLIENDAARVLQLIREAEGLMEKALQVFHAAPQNFSLEATKYLEIAAQSLSLLQKSSTPAASRAPADVDSSQLAGESNGSANATVGEFKGDVRAHSRKTFFQKQLVAPVKDGRLPCSGEFIEVDCNDISQGGISLFMKRPPSFKECVVCLGPDNDLRLLAQVVHVRKSDCEDRHGFKIGCQFLGRIE
jgi:hypothetical protein